MLQENRSKHLSSAHSSHVGSHDEPHVMPLKLYLGVFGALLVLTVVTVGVSLLGLPPLLSILVAMGVASIKAALVAGYFMHLKFEDKFYSFILVASLFFIALFFGITLVDMNFRDYVISEQGTEVYRKYELGGSAKGSYVQPEPIEAPGTEAPTK
jgi:cytochrome c oxidase subunit IV